MKLEEVKAFYEKLSKDENLQKSIQEKEKAYTGDKNDRDAAAEFIILSVAKEVGFNITIDDLKEYEKSVLKAAEAAKNGEIGDEDLGAVSGGLDYYAGGSSYDGCVMTGITFGDDCVLFGFVNQEPEAICIIVG